jgi:chemotaxis protein CheD
MKIIPKLNEGHAPDEIISRFLKPGEFYFGDSDCQIHTILGSCISITLWHPELQIGGMCHFVLPGQPPFRQVHQADEKLNGRYADHAMALFEREILGRGTAFKHYQAKIFGGSNMLTNATLEEDTFIGKKNTESAIKHLTKRGMSLLVAHVGETGHRRIAFDIKNGDVWVKHSSLCKEIPSLLRKGIPCL